MQFKQLTNRLMLLLTLAFLGFLMVYVPPWILQQYETVKTFGDWAVYLYFTIVGLGSALLAGTTLWMLVSLLRRTWKKRAARARKARNPSELSSADKRREVDENLDAIDRLRDDEIVGPEVRRELQSLCDDFRQKHEHQTLEIVAFGTISCGKSSLLNALAGRDVFETDAKGGTTVRRGEVVWPGSDRVLLVDTPGLGEVDGQQHIHEAARAAKDADLVLMVVDGPLREAESQLLKQLAAMEKRILLCINKSDWYAERKRTLLESQIAEQTADWIVRADIVRVSPNPAPRQVVRVGADGGEIEDLVPVDPDISALAKRMLNVVRRDGANLLLANLLLRSRGLMTEAQAKVREDLDQRARVLVDRYAWGAGGAAAVSPLPMLDLAAGGAITTKMVIDLSRVYKHDIDSETAVNLLAQLGKNLLAILGVSAATPLVVSACASLMKTVPGAGTIAGGLLQGIVQALITRWIGAVFIEYFQDESVRGADSLAAMARKKWEHVTSVRELARLVAAARSGWSTNEEADDRGDTERGGNDRK
jgi:small GTP-binding protein